MENKNTAALPDTNDQQAEESKIGGLTLNFVLSLILIVAIGWTGLHSIQRQYESELDANYESLANSIFAVRNLINFEDSLQTSYEGFDLREAKIFTDVAELYFDYNGVTEQTLSDFADEMGDCSIYYFPNEGAEITSDNAGLFPLGKSQMRMLKTIGTLETDDYDYTMTRMGDGWLCIKWNDALDLYSVDFQKILETCPHELCVIENATGALLVSSGQKTYDFLNDGLITFDEKRTAHEEDGIQAGFLKEGPLFSGVYFEKIRLLNRYSVFVYEPLSSTLSDAIAKIAPVYCLILLTFIYIWFCALRMKKQGETMLDRSQCLRLGKHRYLNLPVLRHVAPLVLAGVLVTSALSFYLPLLNNYISHNAKMERNLSSFVSEMELSDEEWGKIEGIFRDLVIGRTETIADFMDMMGDDFDAEVLEKLARSMDFVSAVVYDENGVAVMSTDGYIGYTLTQNPNDDEYVLWNLLNQSLTSLMQDASDHSGFFAAVRRTDAPGVVYVTLTDYALRAMREQTDVNAALLRVNTDTYAKMYTSADQSDKFLWATASASAVRSISNNLPETVLMNRYSGMQTISGYDYYLNTMTDDNHIIISVEQSRVFTESVRRFLAWVIPEILLIALFILNATCTYRCMGGWLEKEPVKRYLVRLTSAGKGGVTPEDQTLDATLKQVVRKLLWILLIALDVLYLADTLFSRHPASDYLFSRQWAHEPSIFSLTTILLSASFAILAIALLKAILKTLSTKLDSRAETFGNLVASITQFALTIVIVIYSLYQVGVDTSVILTSAGVISLIIGYGSQSIVSDLVSGIFLILEDQVRIGEVIEIDGFLGTVTHIGLRTTRAEYFNRAKVINNSKMMGFYNLSRDTSAAHWTIGVSIDQDIEEVTNIILNNTERFYEALGSKLTKGPIYVGVDKVTSDYFGYHYLLHFLSVCDVIYWVPVRTRSFETACKILVENGIKPTGGALLNT